MSKQESNNGLMRQWVETWKRAGKELAKIRNKEVAEIDTAAAIRSFDKAFAWALKEQEVRPSSGFVEQQRLFKKYPRD